MGTGETGLLDGAEVVLILLEVVVEGHEETLGVDGVHEDTLANRGAFLAGQGLCKVEDELRGGVGYDCQVAVGALGYLVADGEV